jgi:ribosomal protein S18 acetylase RimI-like enzyme
MTVFADRQYDVVAAGRSRAMTCRDWRDCPAEVATTLLSAEVRAWHDTLDWDVREAWSVIEPSRRAGVLPGFIVFENDRHPAGWCSFLLHRDCLQVMALVARRPEETVTLVDAVLHSSEAARSTGVLVCARDAAPELPLVLAARGFRVETYRYLVLDKLPSEGVVAGARPWDGDKDAMARLCAKAYASSSGVRAFAPGGTDVEWREYVGSLVDGPGCGRFEPGLSRVVPDRMSGELDAAVIMTTIAPGVAHVAQTAVAPGSRSRGLGTSLVRAALRAASRRGCTSATLLVAAGNTTAARLYHSLGFRDRAAFVVAARDLS